MSKTLVDVADLDCIYLSYDEPDKEETWIKIQNMIPWATRVDGVVGSDAAHKAAAALSTTDRFILVDGDNLPNPEFFNKQLEITEENNDHVFRWKAQNHINGLVYGNGGLSCWTKEFVNNMQTHENSDGADENNVEFCYDPKYIAMNDCYSTTYPNQSPLQAFRAGFREGVKMCLNKGVRPTLPEFEEKMNSKHFDNLLVWMNVGIDIPNGLFAMQGARYGTYKTMLTDWDYTDVQDFDQLYALYGEFTENKITEPMHIDTSLQSRLGLELVNYTPAQSSFFKYFYGKIHKQRGVMVTEIEVIRKAEGW
tara:strand:+ start:52 stop:978 length:927 start_codon:yes stop_codon:yes gene_type:complete